MGTLYLVATPIGNLEDLSGRALRVLQSVELIAAEDTRQTGKLLNHFDVHTRMISYHEHNKLTRLDQVLAALEQGQVALVSDAGTPALNDPGYELVRAALQAGHEVSPIPGPCAPLAALVVSGLPTDTFLYLGYLPRKPAERRKLLESVANQPHTLLFLETPHRLISALNDLRLLLGNRQIAIARELTKMHEEIFRGRLDEALLHFQQQPPRGEFTLVIAGFSPNRENWTEERVDAELDARLMGGEPPAKLAAELASESGWPRRKIYQKVLRLQDRRE
jgi:16S rRNA (cytidine1402-2'-O)-methyltransferase